MTSPSYSDGVNHREKLTVLKHAKAAVHEIISDEARHGMGFEELMKGYLSKEYRCDET